MKKGFKKETFFKNQLQSVSVTVKNVTLTVVVFQMFERQ
jgi:hypothetical protein